MPGVRFQSWLENCDDSDSSAFTDGGPTQVAELPSVTVGREASDTPLKENGYSVESLEAW